LSYNNFISEEINNSLNSEIEDLKNKKCIVEEENAQLFSQLAELNNLLTQKDTELQELNNTIFEKNKLIEVSSAPSENVFE